MLSYIEGMFGVTNLDDVFTGLFAFVCLSLQKARLAKMRLAKPSSASSFLQGKRNGLFNDPLELTVRPQSQSALSPSTLSQTRNVLL